MNTASSMFHAAKALGHKYVIIIQKKQDPPPHLTFSVSGNWGKVQMTKMEFCSSGPYSGGKNWGYSCVAIMNTEEPWEEHEAYLGALDFHW